MRIGIISGSIRASSESERVAGIASKLLMQKHPNLTVDLISLHSEDIPVWDEEVGVKGSESALKWAPISARLKACDGYVVVTPEWAGMSPPHLKNFLLLCASGELAHKPGQIIAVSAGMGGAYPVVDLRATGYKNSYIIWMPDHMILRNVTSLFVESTPSKLDVDLTARMQYGLDMLVAVAGVMPAAVSGVQNLADYPNGM